MRKRWIILILVLMALIVAYSYLADKNINWYYSLDPESKHPYGTKLFIDLLEERQGVKPKPVSNYLDILLAEEKNARSTYLCLCPSFERDSTEIEALLTHAKRGNQLVIAAQRVPYQSFRQLFPPSSIQCFVTRHNKFIVLNQNGSSHIGDTIYQRNDSDTIMMRYMYPEFSDISTKPQINILVNEGQYPLMLKYQVGMGSITMFIAPLALTNYHLRNPAFKKYADLLVSQIPAGKWFLDVMAPLSPRNGEAKKNMVFKESPLRYILSQRGLREAWYLMLTGVLLFMLFFVKRRQRAMKAYVSKENTSLDEVKTLSNLVQSNPNYREMANIRVQYLLQYLRENHQWEPGNGANNIDRLHLKSGVKLSLIKSLIQKLDFISKGSALSEAFFIEMQRDFNQFYDQMRANKIKRNKND